MSDTVKINRLGDGKISAYFIFETALIDENYNLASANGTKYLRKYF